MPEGDAADKRPRPSSGRTSRRGGGQRRSLNPEERRIARVEHAVANPVLFGELYMRPYTDGWTAPLPMIAGAMLLFCESVNRGVIWTPPEFLKSTVVSQLYPLWLTYSFAALGRIGELAGMIACEEQKAAEKNMGVVSWHIENNERLQRDFVDMMGHPLVEPDPDEEKWTDSTIIVRRPGKAKDPTWEAKGIDAKGVQGARLSHLIGDDVVTPRTAGSPAMQRRALQLWDNQFTYRVLERLPGGGPGRAIAVGNYNGPRDLLATLAKRKAYRVLKRPALHVPGDPATAPENAADPNAVLALPGKWSRARLQADREEKPNAFRRMMLMDPKAEVGERLKVAWVRVIPREETPLGEAKFVIAIDPAPGPADETDAAAAADPSFFNLTIAALHQTKGEEHLDIVECFDMRSNATEQAELVAARHDLYARIGRGVHAIGIGKVALDTYFGGALKILRRDVGAKLVPIPISDRSKNERIEALGPFAKSGWLRVHDGAWTELTSDETDRHQELSLFEQWRDFPAIAHNDKLDAVDVACRTAITFGARGDVKTVKLGVA